MMRPGKPGRLVAALIAGALASGCAFRNSPAARTYVLDPMPAPPVSAKPAVPVAVVGVHKVTVPGWIDRPQITGRTATGEVASDDYARWGEPIGRGIQRVLAENLAVLLPDRRLVAGPFSPGVDPDQRVEVTITEAARQADGSVLVEARWSVLGPRGQTLVSGRSSHRAGAGAPGAAGAVAGINDSLAAMSREIAEAVSSLPGKRE
jgi:uncharacterized lipoprotein YmbA